MGVPMVLPLILFGTYAAAACCRYATLPPAPSLWARRYELLLWWWLLLLCWYSTLWL